MSYIEGLFIVVLTTIASAMVTLFIRGALDLDFRRRHYDIGNSIYLQLGVVFAVLLAFVFNEVWGEYNLAKQAINGECSALHGAAILAHDLPDRQGLSVEQAILNYVNTVKNLEWTALEHREESPEALSAFVTILDAGGRLNITRPADSIIQSQILSRLAQAHAYRETRIFQANQGTPIIVWLVLSFYAFVLVIFVLLAGVESRIVHLLFTSSFTSSVVLLLILIRMLDYPFEGALALGNSDFSKTIERVTRLTGTS